MAQHDISPRGIYSSATIVGVHFASRTSHENFIGQILSSKLKIPSRTSRYVSSSINSIEPYDFAASVYILDV